MTVVLIIAFAASLGVHALALFGPEFDLSNAAEPTPLVVELSPLAKVAPLPDPLARSETSVEAVSNATANAKPQRVAGRKVPRRPVERPAPPPVVKAQETPVPTPAPAAALENEYKQENEAGDQAEAVAASLLAMPAPTESRLPARGMIRYRVDRGDQGFAIGHSTHDWEIVDGAYRFTAVTETTGLVALFKPLRVELESRGRLTVAGLVPEHFVTREAGHAARELAEFDWANMQLRMPGRPAQALTPGAQDLLSFNYQLGLLANLASGSSLPVATGKKYGQYRLEVVGDEEIEVPAGTFRCLHLRVPGGSTTELWLAYDRALLPVKIQHTDRKGDVYVQLATTIELSQEQ